MSRAAAIRIVEVGPHDGLQNEAKALPPAARVALIEALAAAGLTIIADGSFASPAKVPQLAGTDEVLASLKSRAGLTLPVLLPNAMGLAAAQLAGARNIAIFAAASDSFSRANIGRGIEASLADDRLVVADALAAGLAVRGYSSCVRGCPFEGRVAVATVVRLASTLMDMGCSEVSLGDTIGVGTPEEAKALVRAIGSEIGIDRMALHFHDAYGQALADVLACLDLGIGTLDASVAGLGGCPYAPGASGNLAAEDLVYMLDGLGLPSWVDLEKLVAAGAMACRALGTQTRSRTAQALGKESACLKVG